MPLPFPLPALSRGYCALTPAARAAAAAAGEAVTPALREVLGLPVTVAARPLPGPAREAAGQARVGLALEAIPAVGALEVEAGLVAEVLARLSGLPAAARAAVPTAAEQSLLELLALVALAAARAPALEALAPRVVLGPAPAPERGALAVHLELEVDGVRGAGRLLWPAGAVAALGAGAAAEAGADLPLGASLREGACTLTPGELAALAEGDVLLLDAPGPGAELLFPGGLAVRGRRQGDRLLIEEVRMTETQAEFPITLAVEVARVTVRLGDLARLEVGGALPLGIPAAGAVVLRAGERAVARGELVEIDGALGVRLAQVGGLP